MTKRKIIRQGDILLVPIDEMPAGTTPVQPENGRLILAHGEATGHHHSIAMSDRVAMFREDGSGGGLFLFASDTVSLDHQEHHALTIAPGAYEVRRQREYAPEAIRRVAD